MDWDNTRTEKQEQKHKGRTKVKNQKQNWVEVSASNECAETAPYDTEKESPKPAVKLRDFVRIFQKDKVEGGVYAFHLKFRYSSRLAMFKGYDPDNDKRIQFDDYEKFIESLPDLYIRSVAMDIGGPNTWCFRVTVNLHEKEYNPTTGKTPEKIYFRD